MKRMKHLFAAALAMAGVLKMETADPECKHNACAMDLPSKMAEQPHASEEPPNFEATALIPI